MIRNKPTRKQMPSTDKRFYFRRGNSKVPASRVAAVFDVDGLCLIKATSKRAENGADHQRTDHIKGSEAGQVSGSK